MDTLKTRLIKYCDHPLVEWNICFVSLYVLAKYEYIREERCSTINLVCFLLHLIPNFAVNLYQYGSYFFWAILFNCAYLFNEYYYDFYYTFILNRSTILPPCSFILGR